MKKIIVLLLLGQCSLLLAASETAEQKRANDPIQFSVSTGVEYTDNRDALPDKDSNFDLYITPRLALDMKWEETTMLAVSYAPTFRYRDNPSIIQNRTQFFHDFGLDFRHALTKKLKMRLLENFNLTDDPSVQMNGSTLRRDASFLFSQTELGTSYVFSRLTNIDVLGRYMVKSYDDSQVGIESDVDKADAGVVFFHQPAKSFAVIGSALYSKFGYSEYLGVDRGFDSVYIGAGFEEVFSPVFRIGVRGGVQNVAYADDSIKSESSPYGTLSAQLSPIPRTRYTLSMSHGVRETFLFPFSSQTSTELGLRMDWESPNPDIGFALSGVYRIGDYNSDNISKELAAQYQADPVLKSYSDAYGSEPSGKENVYRIAAEVSFKLGHGTKMLFVQSYENVDSDVRWSFNRNASNIMLTREF